MGSEPVKRTAIDALLDAADQIEDGGLPGSSAAGYYGGYERAGYQQAENDAVHWLRREAARLRSAIPT